jgi:hypothetical protein
MGWTSVHKENEKISEFFRYEFRHEGDAIDDNRIVDCAVVHIHTAYIAYRNKNNHIVCYVVLLRYNKNDYYNFSYKDMHECEGPCYYDCPARILNKLTSIDELRKSGIYGENILKYMEEWRNKCRSMLKDRVVSVKLNVGDKVKFADMISFRSGRSENVFTVYYKKGKRTIFTSPKIGICTIRDYRNMKYEVIK